MRTPTNQPVRCVLAGLLLLGSALAGCNKVSRGAAMGGAASSDHASVTPAAHPQLDPGAVVATIDGRAVTLGDVDKEIKPQLGHLNRKFETDMFELRKQQLDDMVLMRLVNAEAKKEGVTEESWIKKHVQGVMPEPATEAEAKKFYDENATRMGGDSFDQAKPHIIAFLTNEKRRGVAEKIFDALKSKAKVEIKLEEPVADARAVGVSTGPNNSR